MKDFVFDPSRLRGSRKQQEDAGYLLASRMLAQHLGSDPLAEFRRQTQRDPRSRLKVAEVADARGAEG
jgi:hypothetical protein